MAKPLRDRTYTGEFGDDVCVFLSGFLSSCFNELLSFISLFLLFHEFDLSLLFDLLWDYFNSQHDHVADVDHKERAQRINEYPAVLVLHFGFRNPVCEERQNVQTRQ